MFGCTGKKGVRLFSAGLHTDAIAAFSKAIAEKPSDAKLYNNRANCYILTQQYEQAYEDATRAIQLDANNANAYYIKSRAAMYLGMRIFSHR